MHSKTIQTYNNDADNISKRHLATKPTRLYTLIETFFKKSVPTADLGCGIGRDTSWLNLNGYPTIGLEPAEKMLEIARSSFPELKFREAHLPLSNSFECKFENLFCCAVLMHIPREQLVSSVISILKSLTTNGRAILSWRSGQGETDGRLFETYHPGQIAQLFESLGGNVLLQEEDGIWHNLVIEKSDLNKREGIAQIQDIITRERKTATYKFALLRALCEVSRYESHTVTWHRDADMVLVPMKRLAVRWIYYYWPLVKNEVRQTTYKKMAFEDQLKEIPYEFEILRSQLEGSKLPKELHRLLKKVAETIKLGPITYAGDEKQIFQFMPSLDATLYPQLKESEFGMVSIPISMWRDLNLFSHWIEDSLTIQWAELTEKINKDRRFGIYLDLITKSVQKDDRSTSTVRSLLEKHRTGHECVWSGKKLDEFAVDHMIPWSLWRNNDLWNLLPSHPKINGQKSDCLPSPELIRKRFDVIKSYWELYGEAFPDLFESQIQRGLGISGSEAVTSLGRDSLEQVITRVNIVQGGKIWNPS